MFQNADELREYYASPVELEGIIIPDTSISGWINSGECFCSIIAHYSRKESLES